MADFYSILKRTIEALPVATGQSRRAVYERARIALNNQLDIMKPPLPPSELSRQRLNLEDSIRFVEEEFLAGKIILNVERENAARVAEMQEKQAIRRLERSTKLLQEEAGPPQPSAGEKEGLQTSLPASDAPYSAEEGNSSVLEPADFNAPTPKQPQKEVSSVGHVHSQPQAEKLESLSPASRQAAQQRRVRDDYGEILALDNPFFEEEKDQDLRNVPSDAYGESDSYAEDQVRGIHAQQKEALGASSPPKHYEEAENVHNSQDDYEYERPKRRLWLWVLLLVVVCGLGAGAYYAYTGWPALLPVVEKWFGMEEDQGGPLGAQVSGEQSGQGVSIAREESSDKDPNRLLDDQGNMNPTTGGQEAGFAVGQSTLPQSAIFYEETAPSGQVQRFDGGASWRLQQQAGALPVIVGRIEVPERNFSVDLTLSKNEDTSISPSHLIKLSFAASDQALGAGLQDIPAVLLKESEEAGGEILASVSVQASHNSFWIALSADAEDVKHNMQLLAERDWLDIPIRFDNGRRARLLLEKGEQGEQAFAQAFAAWNTSP